MSHTDFTEERRRTLVLLVDNETKRLGGSRNQAIHNVARGMQMDPCVLDRLVQDDACHRYRTQQQAMAGRTR